MSASRILIIEDTSSMALLYSNYIAIAGHETDIAADGATGLKMLSQRPYQALVLDMHLPDMHGLEVLRKVRQYYDDMPVIVITAFGSIGMAVQSIRNGAFDFVTKPFSPSRINTTIDNALRHRELQLELKELRRETHKEGFHDFIGSSPAMQAAYRQVEAVAAGKANIFIGGEEGTGKELAARTIHKLSSRAARPFISMDMAAIDKDKQESELFGHALGAFAGAMATRTGCIEATRGGTLFLENIHALGEAVQAKILRFIQTGLFAPQGSEASQKTDIRFICASPVDMVKEVENGTFREDLFHRLHVIPFEMPALRERDEDVVELAAHFLKQYAAEEAKVFTGFEPEVLALLRQQEWPENVQQLANIIRHVVMLHDGPRVQLSMLPSDMQNTKVRPQLVEEESGEVFMVKPLWQIEKETIMRALKSSQNDVPRAAALLEVSPSTIYRKLQAWRGVHESDLVAVGA